MLSFGLPTGLFQERTMQDLNLRVVLQIQNVGCFSHKNRQFLWISVCVNQVQFELTGKYNNSRGNIFAR